VAGFGPNSVAVAPSSLVGQMKVIFLDVDGVLHPASAKPREALGGSACLFGERQMECLARAVRATSARIVLSSAWRLTPSGVEAVNRALGSWGLPSVMSCTTAAGESRVEQIWSWLAEHRSEVDGYAVVDDMDLSTEAGRLGPQPSPICGHFVRTPSSTGLSSAHLGRIVTKLNQPPCLPDDASALWQSIRAQEALAVEEVVVRPQAAARLPALGQRARGGGNRLRSLDNARPAPGCNGLPRALRRGCQQRPQFR